MHIQIRVSAYVHISICKHACKCVNVLVLEKVPVDGTHECVTDEVVGCLFMKKSIGNLISSWNNNGLHPRQKLTKSLLDTYTMVLSKTSKAFLFHCGWFARTKAQLLILWLPLKYSVKRFRSYLSLSLTAPILVWCLSIKLFYHLN